MDPFEPIRFKAAALHEQLLSEGEDPFEPLELVQAAVARRDLELVWLPKGDPALKGSRALYDDQGGTICCEEDGDPVTRALLVAHELGHSELHAPVIVLAQWSRRVEPFIVVVCTTLGSRIFQAVQGRGVRR